MLFLDEGSRTGPVIVFVHGIPGSVVWFAGVAERLAGDYRVIRVDVRDLGAESGDFTAAARTAPILALFDELDLSQVTVVGHSFGAEIALELAAVSPRGPAA